MHINMEVHMNTLIRPNTVKLISKLLAPWTDEGIISVAEQKEILSQLKHLAEKGENKPSIMPRLIDQKEAAGMLGIGISNFKKLEKENYFPFKRRMVGSAVRYRNTDIIDYVLSTNCGH